MLEENGKAVRILMELLDGLNRSVPHIDVMSIIFDILISLAEFQDTRTDLAGMEDVYTSVLKAMGKGEKNSDVFGKGCSIFWRLASEVHGRKCLKSDYIMKKLAEFEETQKRKQKQTSGSSLSAMLDKNKATALKKKTTKTLTTKHGCQLTENIVRYHSEHFLAISVLMKRLRK